MLPGQVFPAPPGLHGIDTNTVLDAGHCRAAKERGFSFCLRYVSRGDREQTNDLHGAEARTILNAGLALMPVQHVARPGWSPTESLGSSYGRNAAAHVREIGFPPGVNVWLDLEGVRAHQLMRRSLTTVTLGLQRSNPPDPFPAFTLVPEPLSLARRFSGVFGRRIFGSPAAGFRTSRIVVIS